MMEALMCSFLPTNLPLSRLSPLYAMLRQATDVDVATAPVLVPAQY